MSGPEQTTMRSRLEELFTQLRDAVASAFARHSGFASKLDESRAELERILMLDNCDESVAQRAIGRAQMMLDAWHGLVGVPVPSRSRSSSG
jgi:hypothetical protein